MCARQVFLKYYPHNEQTKYSQCNRCNLFTSIASVVVCEKLNKPETSRCVFSLSSVKDFKCTTHCALNVETGYRDLSGGSAYGRGNILNELHFEAARERTANAVTRKSN